MGNTESSDKEVVKIHRQGRPSNARSELFESPDWFTKHDSAMWSPNAAYYLKLEDGPVYENLVLRAAFNTDTVLWETGPLRHSSAVHALMVLPNGTLAFVTAGSHVLYTIEPQKAGKWTKPRLVLQDDGNLVVYAQAGYGRDSVPIWESGTWNGTFVGKAAGLRRHDTFLRSEVFVTQN